MPLVDLRSQYTSLRGEFTRRLDVVFATMELFVGENVQAFEEEFAGFCDAPYGVGVGSGTEAIQLALMGLGVGEGDEVITVAHTFFATVEAIHAVGAKPVFVDIDAKTYTMDVAQIEERITKRTKAILPVHLYGHPAEMDAIVELANAHGLYVVEDACQAHGARYKGQRVGGIGDVGCFSFYFTKNLGAYGEGGFVACRSAEVAERIRMLRNHGQRARYYHDVFGFNGRLDELQAAFLRVKLPYLERWNELRRGHARYYTEALAGLLATPYESEAAQHVYHLYVVRTAHRDRLRDWLLENGIGTGIHYPVPCHLQAACKGYGYRAGDLPVTEKVAREVLSLPLYPELTEDQRRYVVQSIRAFFEKVM